MVPLFNIIKLQNFRTIKGVWRCCSSVKIKSLFLWYTK